MTSEREVTTGLLKALEQKSNFTDTHPSLAERLEALGCAGFEKLEPPSDRASHELFEPSRLAHFIETFSADWLRWNGDAWKNNHTVNQSISERIGELDEKRVGVPEADDSLSAHDTRDEAFEHALLVLEQHGVEKARPIFERFVDRFPDDGQGHLLLGQLKFSARDTAGEEDLLRAIEIDVHQTSAACEAAITFWMRRSEHDLAQRWVERSRAWERRLDIAHRERHEFSRDDTYLHHDLDPDVVSKLVASISDIPKLKRVWLARKLLMEFPEHEVYILGFELNRPLGIPWKEREWRLRLAERLDFEQDIRIFHVREHDLWWLRKSLRKLDGSCVHGA